MGVAAKLQAVPRGRPGFRVPRRTALVEFEQGHDYHGAEIELRLSVPVSVVLDVDRLRSTVDGDGPAPDVIAQALDVFAGVLLEWNLEDDDGNPLPPTPEGLRTLPLDFLMSLMKRWTEVVAGVSAPLAAQSPATMPAPPELGLG